MSVLNNILAKVSALTTLVNSIISNSKKIEELPEQSIIDTNSDIHVSKSGTSERLKISQIISKALSLFLNNNNDQITTIGTITRDGNNFTFSDFEWRIGGVNYSLITPQTITIDDADAGSKRIDIAVFNTYGNIIKISGEESETIAIQPPTPLSTILITSWNIEESTIDEGEAPIIGTDVVKKSFSKAQIFTGPGDGEDLVIPLNNQGYSVIVLQGTIVNIKGLSFDLIEASPSSEYPYEGKIYTFINETENPIILNQNVSFEEDINFQFNNETDLIIPPKGRITFMNRSEIFEEDLKSWNAINEVNGLPEVLDLKADVSYVDSLVVGLWNDRGPYNASSNTFPSSGGSGASGAIKKGDIWTISVAGTLGSEVVEIGDTVRALVDSPSTTPSNWAILQNNIGYVPENSVNKATTMTGNTTSNIVFLTAKAIYDWAVGKFQDILVSGTNIKTINGSSILGSGNLTINSGSCTVIGKNVVNSSAVTGSILDVNVENFTIPANTFQVGDLLILRVRLTKTGTASGVMHRHGINSLVLFFTQLSASSSLYSEVMHTAVIKSTTDTQTIQNTGGASPFISQGQFPSAISTNIDWTVNNTLNIAVRNGNTADSTVVSYWQLERIR